MLITSNMYHFCHSKDHLNLQFTALHVYITMGNHYDYVFILTFPLSFYAMHYNKFESTIDSCYVMPMYM